MRAFIGIAALALVAAGCGQASHVSGASCTMPPAVAVTSIQLTGLQFVPSCAKVTHGVNVTFTNEDAVPHTVTTDAGQAESFDVSLPTNGSTFTHAFVTAGTTIHIHCNIHAGMVATIFVE